MGLSISKFFSWLEKSPAELPHFISIPTANVTLTDDEEENKKRKQELLEGVFEPEHHYFTVRVNEMYLKDKRQWFKDITPMVLCYTKYMYGEVEVENPFVVGNSLIDSDNAKANRAITFKDTRVAGIHPFSGGRLIVQMVLCKAETKDHLKDALNFIENLSGVFNENITSLVKNFFKVSNVVISGLEKLSDSGAITPLFGYRLEFDRDGNDRFSPGYFAIIDKSDEKWDAKKFFVNRNCLLYGDSAATAQPFRDDEYLLFSVTRSTERSDYKMLPVYKTFKEIADYIDKCGEISEEKRKEINRMKQSLRIQMKFSPDLTDPHGLALMNSFLEEINEMMTPLLSGNKRNDEPGDEWSKMAKEIDEN